MRFSICLFEPEGYKYSHFLYDGCKYMCYTIEALGYDCCIVKNRLYSDRINIILGAHNLKDHGILEQTKKAGKYIIFQSEVLREGGIAGWQDQASFHSIYVPLMRQATAVWDGMESNQIQLRKLGIVAELVPRVGYLPALEEIAHKKNKDIDFLYYGSITAHRKKLIDEIRAQGGNVVTIFDEAAIFRNDYIARTRVHLAPNQGPGINHISSRILYLLNNRAVVVVERCHKQEWIEHCFPSSDADQWAALCMKTLQSSDLDQLADAYFENYKKLNMAHLFQPLLDKLLVFRETVSDIQPLIDTGRQNISPSDKSSLLPHFQKEALPGLTSIIIPVHSIHLDECLSSIKKYTDKPHEIIFLDHGAAPKLKKLIMKAIKDNCNYKVIKIDRKVNFTQSLNVGINQSTGEYIALLFDDVIVYEGWHADMLGYLHSGKKIGIVGAMSNDASGLQMVGGIDFNSSEKRLSFRERNRHRRIYTRNIDGFCLLFRRDLLIQIDLFDEVFGAGKHVFDDFCVRAVLEGYNNVIAGNVFVHNRGGINRLLSRDKTLFDEKWIGLEAATPLAEKVLIANSMELAHSQYHKGDIVDAVQSLIARIGFSPNEKRLFYQIAEILLAENKFQEALDALKGISVAEDDAEYYALLGYGNEGLGLYKVAEEFADKALAIDGKSALALNLKGILAYKKDEMRKAEEYFRRAIEADPGFGEPYTNIGMLRWKAEQKEEAVNLFEKGFVLLPDRGNIITSYYTAISSLELYGKAENIFREARTAYPENKRILFLLIDIFLKQGKFPDAMQEVEKAMVQFGMDTGILSAALEIRRKIGAKTIAVEGGKAKAVPTLSVCMIVKNEEKHLAYCLNSLSPVADEMIVVDTGSTDKTKEIAEVFGARVFDIEWTNDFAVARNHSLSKAHGDWILVMDADEVISFQDYAKLKKLISRKDKIAYNLVTRNYINKTAGDGWMCNDSTYIHEQAGRGWFPSGKVRLFPNNEKIRFENPIHELVEYSIMKIGMGKQESGIPVHHYGELDTNKAAVKDAQYYELGVQKMKESGGDFKSVWELAVQAGELGKLEESIELWHKVLGFKQREAAAYFNLANHYLHLGKYEDSYDCSRKSYALDPKDQSAVLSYAMCEFLAGDIHKTISTLEGFLKGTDTQTSHVGLLALSYLLAGETDRGLRYIRGLVKKKYNCVYYFKDLAQSLIGAGNLARAKALLTAAIEIKFYDQETSALLAQCEANVGRVT
jgi:glycosyltransferase involved in cell wall biosynthesis